MTVGTNYRGGLDGCGNSCRPSLFDPPDSSARSESTLCFPFAHQSMWHLWWWKCHWVWLSLSICFPLSLTLPPGVNPITVNIYLLVSIYLSVCPSVRVSIYLSVYSIPSLHLTHPFIHHQCHIILTVGSVVKQRTCVWCAWNTWPPHAIGRCCVYASVWTAFCSYIRRYTTENSRDLLQGGSQCSGLHSAKDMAVLACVWPSFVSATWVNTR